MPDRNQDAPLHTRVERQLPFIYLVLAGVLTTLLCFLTAPFFTPDEANHACRAISLGHGALVATMGPTEAGGHIDENVFMVMDAMSDIRIAWEKRSSDFHNRPYGAIPEEMQQKLASVRWARRTVFVPFANTAVYPPVLYLPAAAAWRIAEAANLTVFQSLRLARLFCAWTAVLLGWLALRLSIAVRWPLMAVLILPSTLFLNAACSQDAILLSVAALLASLLARTLFSRRDFKQTEIAFAAILLALCGSARPPYIGMAFLLFLPRIELAGRDVRRFVFAFAAVVGVLAACGFWRHLVAPLGIEWADQADPELQAAFLRTYPFAGSAAVLQGTLDAATDFVHRGLYVVGWNDLLAPRWLVIPVACCLAAIFMLASGRLLRTWRGRLMLTFCIAAPLCGISLAEYVIWTPPGFHTVYGIQPRYWLVLMPLAGLLLPDLLHSSPVMARITRPQSLLVAATALLAVLACSLPWVVAQAFYRDTVGHVLLLNLR